MNLRRESVDIWSQGVRLACELFLPGSDEPAPTLVVCHGAGEFKEHYFEMCEYLAERGIGSLALDMHGHGQSGGARFHVRFREWLADIRAVLDFLGSCPGVDPRRLGAFGLSSGGTAVLEAGLVEPRLKVLVVLDPTVTNSPHRWVAWLVRSLTLLGKVKRWVTGSGLRVPLANWSIGPKLASAPEINRKLLSDPRSLEAFLAFPLPGAEQAFLVDTLKRVHRVVAPTLVLWGEDDTLDPPATGHRLLARLTCPKALHVIPGNGHVGHLDRNRAQVFALTAEWVQEHLSRESQGGPVLGGSGWGGIKVIEGELARNLSRRDKWDLLSPFLRQHGREPLAYATLQTGMEYFVDPAGYIAYTTVQHPVFSPRPRRITLSEPVCAPEDLRGLVRRFLEDNPRASFGQISESCAEVLRGMGFKINCIGYEPVLPIQSYNTQGNWKELDLIKRARNEARREHLLIREEPGAKLDAAQLTALSARWIETKKINDREIWLYARRPIFDEEPDVRKFVAYDREGRVVGFAFYDPMYRAGKVYGYAANIVRCDEQRYGRLATALHMEAMDRFRAEGKEVLNLMLAPFVGLELGKYNDDFAAKAFFQLSARYGNNIYNFKGLSFHKTKYRGRERPIYYASNSAMPSNDIYLAFLSADITRSYFTTVGQLLWGMICAVKNGKAS